MLVSFKAEDQLSIYLKHNDFSQEHELLKDIKIGNTILKGELPSNFDSVSLFWKCFRCCLFKPSDAWCRLETFFSLKGRTIQLLITWNEHKKMGWWCINRMLQVYFVSRWYPSCFKIAQMWLVGAVVKVYDPYAKFDYVLDGWSCVGKDFPIAKLVVLVHRFGNWFRKQG